MPTDSQRLAQSVVRLARRLRQERHSELTATQLSVLGALLSQGPLTPGAIAAHERVQPPSMTRTINCLFDDGLITRAPHPEDGRQVVVSISDKGDGVIRTERARRDQWLARQFTELTAEERKVLRKATTILERLTTQ